MSDAPQLEAYHFHERDWDSYEQLCEDFEFDIPDTFNMADYVCDRWAEADEERVALYAETKSGERSTYTFSNLQAIANSLANSLQEEGVERGDRIAVSGSQKVETIVGHLAAWKLGAVSVPLSNLIGSDGMEYRLSDCEPSAFVVDEAAVDTLRGVRDALSSLETVVVAGQDTVDDEVPFWEAVESHDSTFETVTTDPEDESMIIYTSGTTGDPKGVVHVHRGLLGVLPGQLMRHNMQVVEDEVERIAVEWSWVASINDTILPAWFYGKAMVAHEREEFDPEKEFELIDRYGITLFSLPPTAARMMMQVEGASERYDLDSVRVLSCGGEAVGKQIENWADETFGGAHLMDGLGQTEAPALTMDCPALGYSHREGMMGKPAIGLETKVVEVNGDLEPVEQGEVGELAIRYEDNPQCFTEYLNKPEKTDEKVQNGWLLTEDLVVEDPDGYLGFESRKDDVIISSGYRIGPEEIEDCLTGHEAVFDAGVIGVPHDVRGEIPKAYVVLVEGESPSANLKTELQEYVKDRLAKYEYPRELTFIDKLPKTSTGKLRRVDLRETAGITGGE